MSALYVMAGSDRPSPPRLPRHARPFPSCPTPTHPSSPAPTGDLFPSCPAPSRHARLQPIRHPRLRPGISFRHARPLHVMPDSIGHLLPTNLSVVLSRVWAGRFSQAVPGAFPLAQQMEFNSRLLKLNDDADILEELKGKS